MTLVRPEWPWYVAQLVVESHVGGTRKPLVLIESILIHAESPDAAFSKATELCACSEHVYRNASGEIVSLRHIGIHDIDSLQVEELHDGLLLQMRVASNGQSVEPCALVRSRNQLSIFGGVRPEFSKLDQ